MPIEELVPPREWPTLGWSVVSWIEHYLCHGPGDVQGEQLFLDEEFTQITLDAYRLFPKKNRRAGRRVVGYACESLPKGRAKSEHASEISVAEFRGPVRFDHWAKKGEVSSWGYEYEPGEPVGRPVLYPFIRCLATEEGQTGNTYLGITTMLTHAAENFGAEWGFDQLDIGTTRILAGRSGADGEIRPSTAGSASKDGGKETFAVADEIHLYRLPELRDMHAMVRRNARKRLIAEPWMLATTTMYEPGQQSVGEEIHAEAEQQMAQARRKTYGFMWHHREGFAVKNWDDDAEHIESLKEAYGEAAEWMDLEGIVEHEVRAPGAKRTSVERYFQNRRSKGENKAIDPDKWEALADPSRNPTGGEPVVLAFDGSDGGRGTRPDDTVLIGWVVADRPHLFLIDQWKRPDNAAPGWRIPRPKVRKKVADTFDLLDVQRMACDPPLWTEQIEAWRDTYGEDVVIDYPTKSGALMGPAIDRFLEALDVGSFTHDGTPELTEYALNALLTTTKGRADFPALAKEKETMKIDGLVAAVFGHDTLARLPEPAAPPLVMAAWR